MKQIDIVKKSPAPQTTPAPVPAPKEPVTPVAAQSVPAEPQKHSETPPATSNALSASILVLTIGVIVLLAGAYYYFYSLP